MTILFVNYIGLCSFQSTYDKRNFKCQVKWFENEVSENLWYTYLLLFKTFSSKFIIQNLLNMECYLI